MCKSGLFLFLFLLLMITSTTAIAQRRLTFGPYVETVFPLGDKTQNNYKTGAGMGVTAELGLVAGLRATGSVGYLYIPGKMAMYAEGDLPIRIDKKDTEMKGIPVRAGLKYRFPFPLLYVKVEGGVIAMSGYYNDGTHALGAPSIGAQWKGLDVAVKYELAGNMRYWGFRAAYLF